MFNFKDWLQLEMPISNFQLLGQWGPDAKKLYKYDKKDIGILTNPKSVEKIRRLWSNSKYDFEFYFLRSHLGSLQREVGSQTPEQVKEKLGIDIQPGEDKITVIFTNNTGEEKIPMTAWAIAHRLGHAIRQEDIFVDYFSNNIMKDFLKILTEVYHIPQKKQSSILLMAVAHEKELWALATAIGTMKSARSGKLVNFFEFIHELVAQYIITGKIRFNPLPRSLVLSKRYAWGKPVFNSRSSRLSDEELKEYNQVLQNDAANYEQFLDNVFGGLVNKIFVM